MTTGIIDNFKFDAKYKTLFVTVSGGADSTILLYSLIKYIQRTNRTDIKIHLNTALYHHYNSASARSQKTTSLVIGRIIELTDAFNLIDSHTFLWRGNENGEYEGYGRYKVYSKHPSSELTDEELLDAPALSSGYYRQELKNIIGSRPDKDSCLLITGTTLNPPEGTCMTTPSGRVVDLAATSRLRHRNDGQLWLINNKDGVDEYRPWGNTDKQGIVSIYKHFEVYDTLFPMTWSCATWDPALSKNFTEPCNECWWCSERRWGQGT